MVGKSRGAMGSRKHGKSGISPKSPKFRHVQRLEAERTEIKDKSRLKDPKESIKELFK